MGTPASLTGSMRLITFLFCGCLLLVVIRCSLISSSKLELCVNRGSANEEDTLESGVTCKEKIVVALTVNSGQGETQTVEAQLNSMIDENGKEVIPSSPIRITVTKTAVVALYPLIYDFTSLHQLVENSKLIDVGSDGISIDPDSICWDAVDGRKGYACPFDPTAPLGSRGNPRIPNFGEPPQLGLYCLHQGEKLWWHAFHIQPPQLVYGITVRIKQQGTTKDSWIDMAVIDLSPSKRIGRSDDGNILASILGDFASTTSLPLFESKMLFVPALPTTHSIVKEGSASYMFIEKNKVNKDGTTCNTIGTYLEAFLSEPGACRKFRGSCIQFQLANAYALDKDRKRKNEVGEFFVSNYGNFKRIVKDDSEKYYLSMDVGGFLNSVITLELNADNMKFITNVGMGEIVRAGVEDFEALSKNGLLAIVIQNTGSIIADFELSVADCSKGINPVESIITTLEPRYYEALNFTITSRTALTEDHSCTVTMTNSLAEVLDVVTVYFSTESVEVSKGAQSNSLGGGGLGNSGSFGGWQNSNCSAGCPWYNIFCSTQCQETGSGNGGFGGGGNLLPSVPGLGDLGLASLFPSGTGLSQLVSLLIVVAIIVAIIIVVVVIGFIAIQIMCTPAGRLCMRLMFRPLRYCLCHCFRWQGGKRNEQRYYAQVPAHENDRYYQDPPLLPMALPMGHPAGQSRNHWREAYMNFTDIDYQTQCSLHLAYVGPCFSIRGRLNINSLLFHIPEGFRLQKKKFQPPADRGNEQAMNRLYPMRVPIPLDHSLLDTPLHPSDIDNICTLYPEYPVIN
jgi:hypothetical protein